MVPIIRRKAILLIVSISCLFLFILLLNNPNFGNHLQTIHNYLNPNNKNNSNNHTNQSIIKTIKPIKYALLTRFEEKTHTKILFLFVLFYFFFYIIIIFKNLSEWIERNE